jgi:ribosome-associated heat shock protein Hsp15
MSPHQPSATIRLDKWLWHARFFKTRSLASKICRARKVRINGSISTKASTTVKPGDVLTFPQANDIRTIKVLAPGERRGPAVEAQTLYEDLTPKAEGTGASAGSDDNTSISSKSPSREKGMGRPTKADRRALDKLMKSESN